MYRLNILGILIWFLYACNNGESQTTAVATQRDTTIVAANSYSDIFLDSSLLSTFLAQRNPTDSIGSLMRNFYNSRNFQAAWFNERGKLTNQALSFWNLHEQHFKLTGDSAIYSQSLHARMDRLVEEDTTLLPDRNLLEQTDLELTEHFFHFARYAYAGKLDPGKLQWYIPRKQVDAVRLLDSLLVHQGANLDDWEPVNPMYGKVRRELKRYYDLQRKGSEDSILPGRNKVFQLGDTGLAVAQLNRKLFLLGDCHDSSKVDFYTANTVAAVKRAQQRFGLTANGVADMRLIKELNVSYRKRIEQLLVNMERMRWVPREAKGDHIIVNIPEFRLHAYNDTGKVFDMRIVVGKSGTSTVVFNDELKYVVFSPYWNVPASIVRNEIMPAMRRNPGYLARKNMEQTGTSGGLPVIRQKPGGSNSLGLVKFLFPNSYNIYFHDTPSKSLFSQDKRAFSHGCIRLAEPVKMAQWLLRDQPHWTAEKINEAMHQSKEKWVTVKQPVPVFISYFTAWVDREGLLHFRDDIYGHDKEMAEQMFARK
ncbi:Murein L,D-transpeptidase YcbB/YkuD [Cnuella takakiae]|uniref:Murein L,D-transpeptidase YcbB/YkuD n=1 Tax=Cnuella takakiae TaxID=1302690 RepID=A0A1M4USU1_9BACT|nr:L,D-transpeptidase family protein [Cnuella takakiae]OLY92785.1 hypothetical protein BUE76_13475 [Cnuella takakiae]SHE59802.1 Murein L,D-transpeptidase YcbB/YkuD [Cnuella takakiae]